MKEPRDYLACCGLYCKMCSLVNGMPEAGRALHTIMKDEGWESFGSYVYPEFEAFWKVLTEISVFDEISPLCQGGCGNPDCQIRICAKEKGIAACGLCADFPCSLFDDFTQQYPFIIENGYRIREIGIEAWLTEQEELVTKGITNRELRKQHQNGN